MERIRTPRPLAFAALTFGLAVVASVASAEVRPWDQEQVTGLAEQLHVAIKGVRQAALNEPTMRDRNTTTNRAAQQYLQILRRLESSSKQLALRLKAGEDRDKTMGMARSIGSQLRDAQETSKRLMVTEPQWQAIDAAIAVIGQLSPYYSDTSPLLPRVINR